MLLLSLNIATVPDLDMEHIKISNFCPAHSEKVLFSRDTIFLNFMTSKLFPLKRLKLIQLKKNIQCMKIS